MAGDNLRVGDRYLTVSGLPVQVLEIDGELVRLQSLASDNQLSVPRGYPLRPVGREEPAFEMRASAYRPRQKGARLAAPDPKPLAPLIDAMLLAGSKTMRGILRELRRKASASCRGRDLEANVRARIYWLRRKGRLAACASISPPNAA